MLQFRYVAHSKCPEWQHWQVDQLDQAAEPSPRHHRHVPPQASNLRALLIIKRSFFCSGGVLHLTHARCPAARSRRASQPSTLSTAFNCGCSTPSKCFESFERANARALRFCACCRWALSSFTSVLMSPKRERLPWKMSSTSQF
jgi:hypothetical protein